MAQGITFCGAPVHARVFLAHRPKQISNCWRRQPKYQVPSAPALYWLAGQIHDLHTFVSYVQGIYVTCSTYLNISCLAWRKQIYSKMTHGADKTCIPPWRNMNHWSDVTSCEGSHSWMEFNSIHSHQDDTPRMHYTHGTKSEGKMKIEKKSKKKNSKKKFQKKKFKKKNSKKKKN